MGFLWARRCDGRIAPNIGRGREAAKRREKDTGKAGKTVVCNGISVARVQK
jgi:hypothetical protein